MCGEIESTVLLICVFSFCIVKLSILSSENVISGSETEFCVIKVEFCVV